MHLRRLREDPDGDPSEGMAIPRTLSELETQVEEGLEQLIGKFEALQWVPDVSQPRPGLLVVTSHGVCFARKGGPALLSHGHAPYLIDRDSEVDFVRDFYLSSGVLDLVEDPSGQRLVCVGAFRYGVDEPGPVFQAVYRAKEAALAHIAPILPRQVPPHLPSSSGAPVMVREVIHEVVKVPCRYCGALVVVTASSCPHCGAPLQL